MSNAKNKTQEEDLTWGALKRRVDIKSFRIQKKKPVPNPTYYYKSLMDANGGRYHFADPEYDLAEIGRAADTESYIMQAFTKKVGLMFKQGYSFVGSNPKTVKYIKERFRQIAAVSDSSIDSLISKVGKNLIETSNAFVYIHRDPKKSGGKSRFVGEKEIKPMAALFVSPPETMQFRLDKTGKRIVEWRHFIGETQSKNFHPDNIAHFAYNRKEGFIFGTPVITPVLDDVRALRKIEENVEVLIHQFLFPLFHYKIGTPDRPASILENGDVEIELARYNMELMASDGGLVTSERHDIKLLGTEGRQLDANQYLKYFRERVFAGLSMSGIDYGMGDTANRATGDIMSQNLIDSVKDYQRVLENFFNETILKQLLEEGDWPTGFDPLDEENKVCLKFNEIDLQHKMKRENHAIDKYIKNAISHREMRLEMGKDPIEIPTPQEVASGKDLSSKYPEWCNYYWYTIQYAESLIASRDESFIGTKAMSGEKLNATREKQSNSQRMAEQRAPTKKTTEIKRPREKQQKEAVKNFNIIPVFEKAYGELSNSLSEASYSFVSSPNILNMTINSLWGNLVDELHAHMNVSFMSGFKEINNDLIAGGSFLNKHNKSMKLHIIKNSSRLKDDIIGRIKNEIALYLSENRGKIENEDLIFNIKSVFDALKYRVKAIDAYEQRYAFILGKKIALVDSGLEKAKILAQEETCEECQKYNDAEISIGDSGVSVLPHHPNCKCDLVEIVEEKE